MLRLLIALIFTLSAVPSFAVDDIPSLSSMVVGNKVIELASTRHIASLSDSRVTGAWISPNAKYLVFSSQSYGQTDDQVQNLFCTRVNEDKNYNLHTSPPVSENAAVGTEVWRLSRGVTTVAPIVSWSLDSRFIAFAIEKAIVYEDSIGWSEPLIKVFNPSGQERASFYVGDFGDISGKIIWSPDSNSFAAIFIDQAIADPSIKPDDKPDYRVVVFNISSGNAATVYTQEGGPLVLEGWSNDGKSVAYATAQDISARSKAAKHSFWSAPDYSLLGLLGDRSPDGKWWISPRIDGIQLTSDADGSTLDVAKEPASFSCWAPNSKMYAFAKPVAVSDDSKLRTKILQTLWMGTTAKYKLNSMCISFDSNLDDALPTWSADSMSMAYVCGGSAYLAQFALREPTMREKVNGGIALSDEEYKAFVMGNAKEIGIAFTMYQCDWDDQLPPKDQVDEKLHPYLRHSDAFLKPGTSDSILQYECDLPQNKIEDPATTVRAYLDAAPGWRVAIYADGRVESVPK